MQSRKLNYNFVLLSAMALGAGLGFPEPGHGETPATLFPTSVEGKCWLSFPAAGFSKPACGVVYRMKDDVSCGMPLGGIDTGCVDLETSGLLGFCTIFNTHVPRRGPINLPILGLNTGGKTWVLCDKQPKKAWREKGVPYGKPVIPVLSELKLEGVGTAKQIHYWGHYPVADLEFETDAPIQVGLRAWSPFLPGDLKASMMPAAMFEVHLRNPGKTPHTGTIAFSFPGPDPKEAGTDPCKRAEGCIGTLKKDPAELWFATTVSGKLASYVIAVQARDFSKVRSGGELGADGAAWAKIGTALPKLPLREQTGDRLGASLAVDFSLPAGHEKIVRFMLVWRAPTWNGMGYNWATEVPRRYKGSPRTFTHMYAKHYTMLTGELDVEAQQTAALLAENHESLLRRVLAWQQVVYTDASLPVWLRESLVNILHLITEDSLWAQAKPPIPGWVKEDDGLFALIECPRECPNLETICCSFIGNMPLVYFFPQTALSSLRGYKNYQEPGGAVPLMFGGCCVNGPYIDPVMPSRGYQITMNGPSYVGLVDRYLLTHGSKQLVDEFYPSVKKATEFTMGLNRGPDGIVSMPNPRASIGGQPWETEWVEWIRWSGIVPHVGGVHMAMARMAERMAEQAGDKPFADQCRRWIEEAQTILDTKMWAGNYYLAFSDEKARIKSDLIFASQMDGQWMVEHHGLPGVFRADRVAPTLATIEKFNVPQTKYGAINFAKPDGTVLKLGEFPLEEDYQPYDCSPHTVMMLAMTYMYHDRKDFGLELVRRFFHNVVCEEGTTWDQPNILRGNTGKRSFGADYYMNMMLWSLPAAMDGKSSEHPCRPGGLVDRILKAAQQRAD